MDVNLLFCYFLDINFNFFLYSPNTKLLDVVAIDHLPSLLPKDSSDKYAAKLLPFLLRLPEVCYLGQMLKFHFKWATREPG